MLIYWEGLEGSVLTNSTSFFFFLCAKEQQLAYLGDQIQEKNFIVTAIKKNDDGNRTVLGSNIMLEGSNESSIGSEKAAFFWACNK